MANDPNNTESIGGVSVSITGDYSQLAADFDAAVALAVSKGATLAEAIAQATAVPDTAPITEAFSGIGDAATKAGEQLQLFDAAAHVDYSDATGQLNLFTTELEPIGAAADAAAAGMAGFASDAKDAGSAADATAAPIATLDEGLTHAGESAHEAEGGLAGFAEKLAAVGEGLVITEALKEFGTEALTTYGNVQKAEISLTALTGSAEEAAKSLEELKVLAITDALSFPALVQADQRLVAFGVSAEQIPGALEAIANASAAVDRDFASVANSFDRLAISGTAGARQLTSLGLSLHDLADAMGVADDEVKKAFLDLDQSERITALTTALEKYDGVAEQAAAGIAGQYKNLGTQVEFILEELGKALAPVVSQILSIIQTDFLPWIQKAVDGFNSLPGPVKEFAVGLGLAAAAIIPLATALGAVGLALEGWATLLPAGAALLEALGLKAGAAAEAHVALAAAETAASDAAVAGNVAFTGLEVTAGLIGVALAGAGAAALATASNLDALKGKWDDFETTVRSHSILDALNAGATLDALQKMGYSLDQIKQAVGNTGQAFGQAATFTDDWGVKVVKSADFAGTAATAVNKLAAAHQSGVAAAQAHAAAIVQDTEAIDKTGTAAANLAGYLHVITDEFDTEALSSKAFADGIAETTKNFDEMATAAQDCEVAISATGDGARTLGGYLDNINAVSPDVSKNLDTVSTAATGVGDSLAASATKGKNAIQQIDDAISKDLATAIKDVITGVGGIGAAFEKIGTDIVDIVLNHIIKLAITPLLNSLDQVLAKIPGLEGLFGQGAATAASGAASKAAGGVAQAAGGSASSAGGSLGGLGSIADIAGVVVNAIAGIVQGFQMAHLENLTGEIEVTTRKIEAETGGNGRESIFGYTKATWMDLEVMTGQLSDLHNDNTIIIAMMEAGVGTGSGGGGTGAGSGGGADVFAALANMIQNMQDTISRVVAGSGGTGAQWQSIAQTVTGSQTLSGGGVSQGTLANPLNLTAQSATGLPTPGGAASDLAQSAGSGMDWWMTSAASASGGASMEPGNQALGAITGTAEQNPLGLPQWQLLAGRQMGLTDKEASFLTINPGGGRPALDLQAMYAYYAANPTPQRPVTPNQSFQIPSTPGTSGGAFGGGSGGSIPITVNALNPSSRGVADGIVQSLRQIGVKV